MGGFGIRWIRFADYVSGRKHNREKLKTCDVCREKFESIVKMEKHRRDIHPNVPPNEANA